MRRLTYHSTNVPSERVSFEKALLRGLGSKYGLYMVAKEDIPELSLEQIQEMKTKSYPEIAFDVLSPYLGAEIPASDLKTLLDDAYDEGKIPTRLERVQGVERKHILWLTGGPTYSFKDYAARFWGRALNYFLKTKEERKTVLVATSGDTGGAIADALHGLENVDCVVFYPRNAVSEGQRRQMTTLQGNVYAFDVNGDFDVCQALAKTLLGDQDFAREISSEERFTSANSISIGRLLPQIVYPFFAYSKTADFPEKAFMSIPCGNFGNMVGTVLAREMGLPIERIICGVNENDVFPAFLRTGKYRVKPSKMSPSSAMVVSHPSNLARLVELYNGWMLDERNPTTGKVVREGVIMKFPDLPQMQKDLFSFSVDNEMHYSTMRQAFYSHGIILDPHGAVSWRALQECPEYHGERLGIVYETADPGKFPLDVERAIGLIPQLPERMGEQAQLEERIFTVEEKPETTLHGLRLSAQQVNEAKEKIKGILIK